MADTDNQSDVYISQIPHEFDKMFISKALVWSISGLHFIKTTGQSKLSSNLLSILILKNVANKANFQLSNDNLCSTNRVAASKLH